MKNPRQCQYQYHKCGKLGNKYFLQISENPQNQTTRKYVALITSPQLFLIRKQFSIFQITERILDC